MHTMHIFTLVGARRQFMVAAAVSRAIREHGVASDEMDRKRYD